MDGYFAKLDEICDLAEKYDALVMVDDSHAVGFVGKTGRGTHEHCGVMDRIDIITGTLGKALGGASGGYTSAKKEIVELLRQRSRPYLFSNSVAPSIVGASIAAIDMLNSSTELRDKLQENTRFFREELSKIGLEILPGEHPIVPVMFGDAIPAVKMAESLLEERRVCHSVFISRRPERQSANQNAGFGGALNGRFAIRGRKICRSKSGTGNLNFFACEKNEKLCTIIFYMQ